MTYTFELDERLGIELPVLNYPWSSYTVEAQEMILAEWESIRGKIPDRIKEVEADINLKQSQLYEEEDFGRSCQLNAEIAELASIINDLWIWYRVNNHLSIRTHS